MASADLTRVLAPPSLLVVLSGGLDSTVLLGLARTHGAIRVETISIDYGQRHMKELMRAERIAAYYGVPWDVVNVSTLGSLLAGSALTSADVAVPDGHYAEPSMRATVVPNRNMILLSIAMGVAIARGLGAVGYGAHAGDHAIYPDCRPQFVDAMQRVANTVDYTPLEIWAPFLHCTKADIARAGAMIDAPLDQTWSCYKGGVQHCGTCGTCVERKEAFVLAGVNDPTEYMVA